MAIATDSGLLTASRSLLSDSTDSFFFDHPLDHLPAMLLLDGIAGLTETRPGRIAEMKVDFHRFCEPDRPVEVSMSAPPVDAERWELRCFSGELVVAGGHVSLRELPDSLPRRSSGPRPIAVDRALVHRHRAENVAIGDFTADTSGCAARILGFPPTHSLRRRDPQHRSPIELIEAARQLITLVGHEMWDVPQSWKYVLNGVRHEQHRTVSAEEDIRLCTSRMSWRRRRVDFAVDLLAADGPVGSVQLTGLIVPPRVYDHLRGAVRSGAR